MNMDSESSLFNLFGSESSQIESTDNHANEINMRLLYKFVDGLF